MARVDLSRQWTVDDPVTDVRRTIERHLVENDMTVVSGDGATIEAKGGSQFATRMIGVWFVKPASFPKRARILIAKTPAGTFVDARIEERLGLALFDGWSRTRYESCFESWMTGLARALGR